jgi:diguanylate cyclase (GGDEF)-like protein
MAENGLQALEQVANHSDLMCIIMDLMMPYLDGLKTTHILKANFTTYHLPIIILTSQIAVEDMVLAVEMGADDYMKKPFDPVELKARLLMNLRRVDRDQNSNPLTKLPGNAIINRIIMARLAQPLAILYADLDNFKAYNDKYGFNMGDKIICYAAQTLAFAVKTTGNPSDFLGHVGGDDFVMVSTPDKAEALAQTICTEFDKGIPPFYSSEDQERKKIIAFDRQGTQCEFPLVSLSIAIVTNEHTALTTIPQIAQIAAELKHYAKSKPGGISGSNFVKDRRGNT